MENENMKTAEKKKKVKTVTVKKNIKDAEYFKKLES